jgi:translation initiation factor 2A
MSEQEDTTNENKNDNSPTPIIQIGVKNNVGVQFRQITQTLKIGSSLPNNQTAMFPAHEDVNVIYTQDGSMAAITTAQAVTVIRTVNNDTVCTAAVSGVTHLFFSPRGTFLVTFSPRLSPEAKENLHIWNMTGEKVLSFYQKEFRPSVWPTVAWTDNEEVMGHLVSNEVQLHNGNSPTSAVTNRVVCPDIINFSFSPASPASPATFKIAAFCKGKNAPQGCLVWRFPHFNQPVASQALQKVDDCSFLWSPLASHVLVLTSIEVKANSYDGENQLLLLSCDHGDKAPFSASFNDKGPIHAACWSPEGKDFLVIHGLQPARAIMYLARDASAVRDFGQAPRNTIRFSPSGRFIMIGGFGVLSGQMDFWDKNRFRLMGRASCADATTFEWTPDSRCFVTAVHRPRRRVSERFTLYTYAGEKIYEEMVPHLYQFAIQSFPINSFPNRPCSPRIKNLTLKQIEEQKPGKYIPPSARAQGGSKLADELLNPKLAGPSKYVNPAQGGSAGPASEQEKENAKRRERRAKARANKAAEKQKEGGAQKEVNIVVRRG